MLQLPHIKARIARLHEVTRGLCKEIVVIGDAEDPLLYLERRAYLAAIHRCVDGLDAARIALAGVVGRMEKQAAERPTA